jgi:epoxyqueuosine reductase QueG
MIESIPCFNCYSVMHPREPQNKHEKEACKYLHSNILYVCDKCGVICYHYEPRGKEPDDNHTH